jgi:hypothetical protein
VTLTRVSSLFSFHRLTRELGDSLEIIAELAQLAP